MQIRVANRQDEPAIRRIVEDVLSQHGHKFDLAGSDSDLNNVESHYFWHDGIFLVAERNDTIVGLIGARPDADGALRIFRLAAAGSADSNTVIRSLIDTCIFFAGNSACARMILQPDQVYLAADQPLPPFQLARSTPPEWVANVPVIQR
jgi:hypothetical protein